MTTPIRIQRKRTKGFDLQAVSREANGLDCVYVGRPTRWGNPHLTKEFHLVAVLLVAANPECFPEQYNLWFGGK